MLPPFPESHRTERMRLERMRASDRPDLVRMHRDPRVMATLGGLRDDAETDRYLGEQLEHWARHGFGLWMLRAIEGGTLIGRGGLRHSPLDGRDVIELAYALVPEAWGRGLATELARESLRVSREVLGRADVIAWTRTDNRASRRVMEKIGLAFVRGELRKGSSHVLYRLPGR